jgi:hypothetical protein
MEQKYEANVLRDLIHELKPRKGIPFSLSVLN